MRSHCCTADRRLSTTTRNARTSSASSVCSGRQGQTHAGQHRVGATAVQPRAFAARPHTGPELSVFQPVTIDEVRKLLASIPSPLYVLPVFLLKDCVDVFAPAITESLELRRLKFDLNMIYCAIHGLNALDSSKFLDV